MKIQHTVVGDIVVMTVSGEPSHAEAGVLRARVDAALHRRFRNFVVDLAGLTRMDASTMGELVGTYALVRGQHGRLILAQVPGRIKYLLAATHVDSVLDMHVSTQDALGCLTREAGQAA